MIHGAVNLVELGLSVWKSKNFLKLQPSHTYNKESTIVSIQLIRDNTQLTKNIVQDAYISISRLANCRTLEPSLSHVLLEVLLAIYTDT